MESKGFFVDISRLGHFLKAFGSLAMRGGAIDRQRRDAVMPRKIILEEDAFQDAFYIMSV
jgi:hypothetical protein